MLKENNKKKKVKLRNIKINYIILLNREAIY